MLFNIVKRQFTNVSQGGTVTQHMKKMDLNPDFEDCRKACSKTLPVCQGHDLCPVSYVLYPVSSSGKSWTQVSWTSTSILRCAPTPAAVPRSTWWGLECPSAANNPLNSSPSLPPLQMVNSLIDYYNTE